MSKADFLPDSVNAFSSRIVRSDEQIIQYKLVNLNQIALWFTPVQVELPTPYWLTL